MIIGYDYEVFEDKGISGKNIEKRPNLQEILKRLNEFDIILVWKLSRLSRSVRDFANMLYDFDKNNVRFISYNEKIDTQDASGKLLMYVISIVAEIERDNISENVKLAKRQDFENGNITVKQILGYDIKNRCLIVNPQEAQIVKFIFETYVKTKNAFLTAKICKLKGYKGKRGQNFHASSVLTIVKNKTYCGYNKFHDSEFKKGKHKAIISLNLYNKANNIA